MADAIVKVEAPYRWISATLPGDMDTFVISVLEIDAKVWLVVYRIVVDYLTRAEYFRSKTPW